MSSIKIFENKPSEWLAHRYYVLGQFEMCISVVNQILRTNPDNPEALFLRGSVLRTKGEINQALICFQSAYELEPENSNYLIEIARCFYFLAHYSQSLKILRDIEKTKEGKNNWEVLHLIGKNLSKLKQFDEAIEEFQYALDTDQRLETFLEICDIADHQNNFQLLKSTIDEAQSLFPANTLLRRRIGEFVLLQNDYKTALANFKFCYNYNHSDSISMLIAASIEQFQLHNEEAIKLYRAAFPGLPNSPALWNNIALCLSSHSRKETIVSCCKRALFYAPFETIPLINIGLTFLEMHMYCSAAIVLKKARKVNPKSDIINLGLGIALMNLEQFDEAIKIFTKSLSDSEPDHRILINLAICYYRSEQIDLSRQTFQQLMSIIKKEPLIEKHYPGISIFKKMLGYKPKESSNKTVH